MPAAAKLTVACLVSGSILAPWYLLPMVGKYLPVDIVATLQTVTTVVFLPLVLGMATYSLLRRRYTPQEIQGRFISCFPPG